MNRCMKTISGMVLLGCAAAAFGADTGGAAWVEDAWVKAMKANDVEAVSKLYAPDAQAWFPDFPAATGWDAIHAQYKGMLDANTVTSAELTDLHHKTSGNLSVGWGNFNVTLAPKAGGDPTVLKGRFLDVAEKRGGTWMYIADHASAEPKPPAK